MATKLEINDAHCDSRTNIKGIICCSKNGLIGGSIFSVTLHNNINIASYRGPIGMLVYLKDVRKIGVAFIFSKYNF